MMPGGEQTMLTSSDVKKALRAAGLEVYRTSGAAVHVADRVRENLIMDAGIHVDGERGMVVFLVRAQQSDFPGDDDLALHGRARALAEAALGRGFAEARSFVTDVTDPGDPDRVLDHWFEVQYEKVVASPDEAVDEVRFVFGLKKTVTR
jgi:hypothetical protein